MNNISELAKLIRYYSLVSTTAAGSGHPTSSLSGADVMAVLMFGGFFTADLDNPSNPHNDRLIFSKGHASPLFYSLYAAAGKVGEEELLNLRKFGSRLEGHPTLAFPYTEVATGSLGQGLSVGVGMALNAKYLDKLPYRTFVLLGDSEMAEGSVWEAMAIAAHYQLNNLVAILDCNRLGQRGETLHGHNVEIYKAKAEAFGWEVMVIDGHNVDDIRKGFQFALRESDKEMVSEAGTPHNPLFNEEGGVKPKMIIAKTVKGKGVSFLEDKDGWHGKVLSSEELDKALAELGHVDRSLKGDISKPTEISNSQLPIPNVNTNGQFIDYDHAKQVATRKAYGNAITRIAGIYPNIVVLDAEVSNSTYADMFKKAYPERFFEMFIAEQNMVGTALGLSRRGKVPFISTFAAFFSRAFDQIRMTQYSGSNIKFIGSHAGVSIGEDGASQMALEDLGMFRSIYGSFVLYPSDAVSAERMVELAAKVKGNVYIRMTRKETPILYSAEDVFDIGGSKTLRHSGNDQVTVVGAGVTVHEAMKAYEELKNQGILIRVIDLYSIKPIDGEAIRKAISETKAIITVEDHYEEGGIAEAVRSALDGELLQNLGMLMPTTPAQDEKYARVYSLAVKKIPKSGTPDELLEFEEINANAIIKKVKELVARD